MTRVRTAILLLFSFPVANNGLSLETAAVSRSGVEAFSRNRIRPPSLPSALSGTVMSQSLQYRRFSSFDRRSIVLRESRINDDRKKGGRGTKETKRRRRWPGKVFSKILQRDGKAHHDAHEPLHATVDLATEDLLDALATDYSSSDQDFLLRNFETLSPSIVLPEVTKDAPTIDAEFFNVKIDQPVDRTTRTESASPNSPDSFRTTSNNGRNISLSRIVANTLENILIGIINRRALEPPVDLQVNAQSRGGALHPLLRGKVNADAKIDVGKLVLPNIRMSGGTLEVKRMTMNVFGFCPQSLRLPSSRFPKQFDLHFQNMIFSRGDLLDSSCIRNGLRRLLVRILRDRGVQASTVKVTSVNILVRSFCQMLEVFCLLLAVVYTSTSTLFDYILN